MHPKDTEHNHTPPASPTSTTSVDRKTDPIISIYYVRDGSTTSSKLPAQQEATSEASEKDPDADGPVSKFMYVLLIFVLLLFAWYIYLIMVLLERLRDEEWWDIITGNPSKDEGKSNGSKRPEGAQKGDLGRSLNAFAGALGISPEQVAAAVKPLVPQASLANISSKAASGSSEAVRELIGEKYEKEN